MDDLLQSITEGLVEQLKIAFPSLVIMRDGKYQITIFNQVNYLDLLLVIDSSGVNLGNGQCRADLVGEIATGVRAVWQPIASDLADPHLIEKVIAGVEKWLSK